MLIIAMQWAFLTSLLLYFPALKLEPTRQEQKGAVEKHGHWAGNLSASWARVLHTHRKLQTLRGRLLVTRCFIFAWRTLWPHEYFGYEAKKQTVFWPGFYCIILWCSIFLLDFFGLAQCSGQKKGCALLIE